MSRRWLFPVVMVVVAAVGAVLYLNPVEPEKPRAAREVAVPAARPLRPVQTPVSTATPEQGGKPDTAGIRPAVRRFMADYLPFSYGNGHPEFKQATPEFRADLLAYPPDVPERIKKMSAKVTLIQVDDDATDKDASVGVMVKDDETRYVMRLVVLKNAAGVWQVAAVGS